MLFGLQTEQVPALTWARNMSPVEIWGYTEFLADELGLRSLTGAGCAQQNQLSWKSSVLWLNDLFSFAADRRRFSKAENYSVFQARSNSLRIRSASSGRIDPGPAPVDNVTLMR